MRIFSTFLSRSFPTPLTRLLPTFILLLLGAAGALAQHDAMTKLSPTARRLVCQSGQHRLTSGAPAKDGRELSALVRVGAEGRGVFEENGCRDLASFGSIHVVSIPMERLLTLAADSRVERIEVRQANSLCTDQMGEHLNIAPVYEGQDLPQAFTGKDVVMGLMDVGFDLTHPNFYSSDMSEYRIKMFWDMLSEDTIGSRLYVGNDYVGEEKILEYAHSRDGLKQLHGTHTLGIAAGSGSTTAFRGVAPEAEICLVSNFVGGDEEFVSEADKLKFTYATDALGFKYLFDYADMVGLPCVISFSEGSPQDLRGDDVLFYELLGQLVGPGRIIVSSAGNNNLEPSYLRKPAGVERAGTFVRGDNCLYFSMEADAHFSTRLKVYGQDVTTLDVASDWLCQQPDSTLLDTLRIDGSAYNFMLSAYPSCYDEERIVMEVYVDGVKGIGQAVPLSVEMLGAEADVELHKMVGHFVENPLDPALGGAEFICDINSPAASPHVICAGSTSYRRGYVNINGEQLTHDCGGGGERSTYSSVGPTLAGLTKPDVMAPGANIISSSSSFFLETHPNNYYNRCVVEQVEHNGRTYSFHGDCGTSMSSPAVAGVIALWLQAKPNLTREEIIDVFAHTCTHPDDQLSYPNNYYGHGQIDAYRGLLYLLKLDHIKELSHRQARKVRASISGDKLLLDFPEPLTAAADISLYSAAGALIARDRAEQGASSMSISVPCARGQVFALQITSPAPELTGSLLLRK